MVNLAEIVAYCSSQPENLSATYSIDGITFNRLLDTKSIVGCASGYSASAAGFPIYGCTPFNLTNGKWMLVSGDCVRIPTITLLVLFRSSS